MLQRQIAKLARRAGVGFLVAVFDRKPTAHQQVEAYQLAVFGDCHEVHVVGMQIDIVLRRDHYCGFELTRQVGLTKDRFFISSGDFFLVEPDLRIRAGTRQQMLRNLLRPLVRFRVQLRLVRVRGAEYVTVHVVSCRQRIKTDRVQHLVHRFDVLFQNAVELKRLAVGQANAAIDVFSPANLSIACHCLVVITPPGRRQRSSIAWRGSSFCSARSARMSRSSC